MEKYSTNVNGTALANFETPFADVPVVRESTGQNLPTVLPFSDFLGESPFSRTYEMPVATNKVTEGGEAYTELLAELNDLEFDEMIYELANEVEDSWRKKVSNEVAMGANYIPFATQQARQYFEPMIQETDRMIDQVAHYFSGNNLADQSASEVEQFFETLEFNHEGYTPAQEQFFGKIFDKVKSVVNKGVELAKKGVAAVGKILPINIVLDRIKGLVKPLLNKVLQMAIGKLPKNLQPHAQTLAKKFLKMETAEGELYEVEGEGGIEGIQAELDHYLAQLLFSPDESESESKIISYEISFEQLEHREQYDTGGIAVPSLNVARQQFIDDLKNLREGESAAPAIERFLPAAIIALQPVIKMAITIIGRQKVINFLAGLLAKLVGKYVPANVAQPLAASIIDVGMSVIGFEVGERSNADLAYEAIANTIEETVQHMGTLNESVLNDSEELTLQLLEGFEKAAADNFPAQYIREELRPSKQKATWVGMPRTAPVKVYKKFTHIYEVTIEPQAATAITTFRSLPLANFLKDKYGLDPSKPIKAKVHLYQTLNGTKLSTISRFETLPGLNAKQPRAWIQLLPLTKQAATLLLKEPAMGKDIDPKSAATRFRTRAGQRYYFLEIDGARLRIPQVNRTAHKHTENKRPSSSTESRSADIQAVINFIKSEIKLNYYFSEEDAKSIVEKLNKNDFLGAAISIRQSFKNVLQDILLKNISSKAKIVHEAVPELYLENIQEQQEGFSLGDTLGKLAGKDFIAKIIEKIVDKLSTVAYEAVGAFFKARAAEFKEAQAQPQDGVTIKLTWSNISGMSSIRTVINAIRGNLSIGNLSDIAVPSFPTPDIKVLADKKFD